MVNKIFKELESVEDILKAQLHGGRPLTPLEIRFKLPEKGKQTIYNELNRLSKFDGLKKVEIKIGTVSFVMYSLQQITRKSIKIKVR